MRVVGNFADLLVMFHEFQTTAAQLLRIQPATLRIPAGIRCRTGRNDFNKAESGMHHGFAQGPLQSPGMQYGPAGYKRCAAGSRQIRQVKGMLKISVLRRNCPGTMGCCGSRLAARHAVVKIINANNGNVQIASGGMDKMIAPDPGDIAIA